MHDTSSTVLIGCDGSDEAAEAICVAGRLLAPRPAVVAFTWDSLTELLLNTDIETMYAPLRDPARLLDEEERGEATAIATRGAELAIAAGFDATPVIARGEPKAWKTLLELGDQHEAAAIVVGSRGLGGVKSALLGSVSSGVLDHAHLPVLIVPPGGDDGTPGPLLAGYDGSDQAAAAIEAAGHLLSGREMLVQTVWVSCLAAVPAAVAGVPAGVALEGAQEIDASLREGAERTAERGAALAAEQGLDARAEAVRADGNIWATLLHAAERQRAAAIVLGSRGRSAFGATLLGSVSRALVHNAPAPVLVVRPPK
jgi:nucleotide-binding universal stress UspA family protein